MITWDILLHDPAWVMYGVSICVSWFTFFLFLWWWVQTRTASEIYIYFTFMLAGNAISDMMAFYSRTLLFINHEAYMDFLQTWIWHFRRIPEMCIIGLIALRMIIRIIRTIKATEEIFNEKTDSSNPASSS